MIRRLFSFVRRSRRDIQDDVDDELRFHLRTRADELAGRGLGRDEALRQAQLEFGDLEDARRYMRRLEYGSERRRRWRDDMIEFQQDVRYALRRLRAAPAFAMAGILTLALGIGANTAIFSIVNGILLRPLPLPDPGRLYAVYSANRTAGQFQAAVSPPDLDDWRSGRQVIEDLGGYFYAEGSTGIDLTHRGQPRRLDAVFVTPGFFTTLGVGVVKGRLPHETELVRGGPDRIVMLSHGFWMREFGGSGEAIGATLTLDDAPYQVLGVLPADFRFPTDRVDVFVPYSTIPDSAIPRIRPVRVLSVVARARAGVTGDAVQAEMNAIARTLAAQYPEDRAWDAATVLPLHEVITGQVRGGLLVLLGAVGFVLLIACGNLAGLQLARSIGRAREMGMRLALGAGRGRLVRQLLTESLVLAFAGCAVGLALARGLIAALLALGAGELPGAAAVSLDGTVLAFSIALTIVTGLLCGVLPALRSASADVQMMLREGGRTTAGVESHRLRTGLVVAEVALAVVLVVGAGLMGRSFAALLRVDAGFRPDHLVAVQFTIDASRHGGPAAGTVRSPYTLFYQQVIEKVRTLPGVVSAAAVKDPPLRGNGERNSVALPGVPVPTGQDPPTATAIHVSDGYFATIGARMVDGREFTPRDRADSPFVIVVNEAFARQFFPGARAVGQTVLLGGKAPVEVVGVVNDIRQVAMAEPARPTMYYDNLQNSRVKTTIVARTAGDPMLSAGAIRDAVWSLDPNQTITAMFTFDDAVSRALARPRLLMVLLASFGAIGLSLGVVGLYGMLVFLVHERRREIGVRLTLGAEPRAIRRMFLRHGLRLTAGGVAIGLVGALGLSRALSAVLFGVEPADPATFIGVAIVLFLTAATASWLPARRAARVDPVEVLRAE